MIYSETNYDIPEFENLDEAYEFFGNHCSHKYDILWCTINRKQSCIIGSSMAEDYEFISPIGSEIEKFLTDGGVADAKSVSTDLTSEVRDFIYEKLESWGVTDIYYYTDTF